MKYQEKTIILKSAERVLLSICREMEEIDFLRSHQGLAMAVGVGQAMAMVADEERFRLERERRRTLWQIRKNKWIKQQKEGDRVEYLLTEGGKIAALEMVVSLTNSRLPPGEFCLVIFDFPEATRRARQSFRRLLIRAGFRREQFSAWLTDKDLIKEMNQLISLLKIHKWVKVFRVKQ